MHIISRKHLNDFTATRAYAAAALQEWYTRMKAGSFHSFAEVRGIFPTADQVGKLTVFKFAGNTARLIAAIHYNRGKVYVWAVLTHAEYDKGTWKE